MSFRRFFPTIWINPTDVARHLDSNTSKRQQICDDIDANGFDWQIWAVAGSGFFTDSYNLFATNVILPSLAFVYWSTDDKLGVHETEINAITLVGSMLGQLIFGYLSDRYGRRKLYGLELIVVIFGTLGVVQCSSGMDNSMDIVGWIMFWRFFVGLGIGAEYPLSAVITAEFAPRRARARMMAAVFMMQPLGQLMASVVGLAVIMTVGRNLPHPATSPEDYTAGTKTVDQIWRIVIGVGAFPALVAIAFRLTIPESPRYTLDVDHDGARALRDTQKYYNIRASIHESIANGYTDDVEGDAGLQQMPRAATDDGEVVNDNDDDSMEIVDIGEAANSQHEDEAGEKQAMPDPFSYSELRRFFWEEGNIKYLVGTSLAWFLLDFAFLGLGINNPKVIAELWAYTTPAQQVDAAKPLSWVNPSAPNQTIYEVLRLDAIQSIITISVGSLLGSAILIKVINYIPRKSWLAWSFVGLAVLFAIVGGTYSTAKDSNLHALTITLYVLSQLLFNLGPNGLTFILPAEIFPTRYRGTCHGISAAAGKLSSVIVQSFLPYTGIANPNQNTLGWILLGFSAAMALGAVVTWSWIPDVQNGRGTNADLDVGRRGRRGRGRGRFREYEVPSKRLEELALGRAGVLNEKRQVGFRKRAACLVGHKEEEN